MEDKNKLFPNEKNPQVIKDNLLSMCDHTEVMVFNRNLTDEELVKSEKEFVQGSIQYAKLQDDFDKVKEDFKGKMKPVEQLQKERLKVLKNKSVSTEGQVFLVADQDDKVMRYYDETGSLIQSRPLMQSERQLSINREAANS